MTTRGKRIPGLLIQVLAGLVFWSPVLRAEPVTARGVVVANAEAVISVSLSARVTRLPFRQGDEFARGDVLVAFDCSRYEAELRARQAVYEGRRVKLERNRRLKRYQAIGSSEVEISKADLDEAKALRDVQAALVKQCTVYAPYDGRVVERQINVHEVAKRNQPLMRVVDTSLVEVDVIVPSKWLGWLSKGTRFSFRIEETGQRLDARAERLGAVVDPVSQTIRITGHFKKRDKHILPGMSGTATFAYSGS